MCKVGLHLAHTPPDAPGSLICGELADPHKMWYYATYVCPNMPYEEARRAARQNIVEGKVNFVRKGGGEASDRQPVGLQVPSASNGRIAVAKRSHEERNEPGRRRYFSLAPE